MSGYHQRNRGAHHPYQNQGYQNRRIGHQGQGDQRHASHRRFSFVNQGSSSRGRLRDRAPSPPRRSRTDHDSSSRMSTPAAALPDDRLEPRRRSSSPSAEQERSRKRHHDSSDFSDESRSRSPSPGDSDSTIAQERRSSKRNGWLSKLAEIFGIEESTKKTNSKKREEMKKLGEEIEDITEEISRKEDAYMKRKEDLRQNKTEHFEKREEAKIYLRGLQAELYTVPGDRDTFTFNVEQYQRNGKTLQELHNDIEEWKVEEAAIEAIESGVRALKGKLVEKEQLQEEVDREMEALNYELDNLSQEIKSISRKIGKSCGRSHRKKSRRSVCTPSNGDSKDTSSHMPTEKSESTTKSGQSTEKPQQTQDGSGNSEAGFFRDQQRLEKGDSSVHKTDEALPIHAALLDHDYDVRYDVEKLQDLSSLTNHSEKSKAKEIEKALTASEGAQTESANEKEAPEKTVTGRSEELGEPQNPSAPAAPQESSKTVTTVTRRFSFGKMRDVEAETTRIQEEVRKEAETSSAKSSEGSHAPEKSRDVEKKSAPAAPPTEQEQGSDKTVTNEKKEGSRATTSTESAQKNQNEDPATSSAASGTSNAREDERSTQSDPELAAKTPEKQSEPKQNGNIVAPKTSPLLSPSEIKEEVVDEGENLASVPSAPPIAQVVKEEAPSPSEVPELNSAGRKTSYKDQWEAPPSRALMPPATPNMQNEVVVTKSPSNRSGVQGSGVEKLPGGAPTSAGPSSVPKTLPATRTPPNNNTPSSLPPPVPQTSSAARENQKKHNLETIVNGLADKVVEDTANQPSTSGTALPRFSWGRTPRGRKSAAAQQEGPQLRSRRK
ncbi:unnamed protein product [Caenorhabditis brenneri]